VARQLLDPLQGDRVLLAVLKLSLGDLGRLRHFSDVAANDFRNVLTWAETPRLAGEPATYDELRDRESSRDLIADCPKTPVMRSQFT
jgi:hypothetical protein